GPASDVDSPVRKKALVEELEAVASPPDRLDFARHQTTRSFPPSTGTCAAVVLAKSAPHISAASSATSFEATSVLRRLFFLYCSTVRLYALARDASTSSVQSAVSYTAFGWSELMRMPSFAHSSAATRASWLRAAFDAE